jgi:hypothetical protein
MCFYRWNPEFNKPYDVPLTDLQRQITSAKQRGCDHVVAVGWGEPTLYSHLPELVAWLKAVGMTSSAIVNGMVSPERAEELFNVGLNHFHVSVHGLGDTLNKIAGVDVAAKYQERFKQYLKDSKRPWRTNTSIQQDNYKELASIVTNIIDHGAFHVVLLGFLPHYEWRNRSTLVAVHPADLRPYLQQAIDICLARNTYVTLRYHPFCHIDKKYWPYITNARYVLYDPWEWDYGNCGKNDNDLWRAAVEMGNSVAIHGAPCSDCTAQLHCGGWNKTYAGAFQGAGLRAITDLAVLREPGAYFDENPVNRLLGYV